MTELSFGKLHIFLNKRATVKPAYSAMVNDIIRYVRERRNENLYNAGEDDHTYTPESGYYIGLVDSASKDGVTRQIDILAGGLLIAKDTLWETAYQQLNAVSLSKAIEDFRQAYDIRTTPDRDIFVRLAKYLDIAINEYNTRLKHGGKKSMVDLKTRAINLMAERIADALSGNTIDMAQAMAVKPASMEYNEYKTMLSEAFNLAKRDGIKAFGFIVEQLQNAPFDSNALTPILAQDRALSGNLQNYMDCLKATRECVVEAAKAAGYKMQAAKARG